MPRKNIWEQLWESTEGPTVTVTIPRDLADALLQSLAASLEQDVGDEGDLDDMDMGDDVPDLDFGGDDMPPPDEGGDDMDLGMFGDDDMPAGDDSSDEEDDEPAPKKKGPGRPPKKDSEKKKSDKDDDSDDDDDKKEGAGPPRPQTALGESAFARLSRKLGRQPGVTDPDALAASIGRHKYGNAGMARKSAAGRRKG